MDARCMLVLRKHCWHHSERLRIWQVQSPPPADCLLVRDLMWRRWLLSTSIQIHLLLWSFLVLSLQFFNRQYKHEGTKLGLLILRLASREQSIWRTASFDVAFQSGMIFLGKVSLKVSLFTLSKENSKVIWPLDKKKRLAANQIFNYT